MLIPENNFLLSFAWGYGKALNNQSISVHGTMIPPGFETQSYAFLWGIEVVKRWNQACQ